MKSRNRVRTGNILHVCTWLCLIYSFKLNNYYGTARIYLRLRRTCDAFIHTIKYLFRYKTIQSDMCIHKFSCFVKFFTLLVLNSMMKLVPCMWVKLLRSTYKVCSYEFRFSKNTVGIIDFSRINVEQCLCIKSRWSITLFWRGWRANKQTKKTHI